MTTFADVAKELAGSGGSGGGGPTNRDKGTRFERFFAKFLETDPQYASRLEKVWLWERWPDKWGSDDGIDIVARERGTGDYWAIQCKSYDSSRVDKAGIDSFLAASGKRFSTTEGTFQFANRLIVTTTDSWSSKAEKALEAQTIPVSRIYLRNLADSPIDWGQFSLAKVDDLRLREKKQLREHQQEAVDKVAAGLAQHDRGKLVMACGTGKTFTALRLMERLVPQGGLTLFLAPSISLVSQSLREWTAEAADPLNAFVVCSDSTVGRDQEDLRLHDLAFPATTSAKKLALAVRMATRSRRTVIFSTYHSIQVSADAQALDLPEFDLVICDEAHRTTGLTLAHESPSEFLKVHDNGVIKARRRVYMTATPRIYGEASKTRAQEASAALYSMDEEGKFGPEFHRLGFGKAVDKDLLSDYKVLIVAVEEARMALLVNNYNQLSSQSTQAALGTPAKAYKLGDKKAIDIKFATKIIGSWKGLSKQGLMLLDEDGEQEELTEDTAPMRRAVAFSRTIKASKETSAVFNDLVQLYQGEAADDGQAMIDCTVDHIDGTQNALVRQNRIDWLREGMAEGQCRVLSNARCLSEGVDVPALDSVIFFDTRDSVVDIVQSVGRVMRKAEGKQYGYIILPVCIPSRKVADYNKYIESDPQFKGIWKVIKALRAHDESLVDEAEFRRKIKVIGRRSGAGDEDDAAEGSGGGQGTAELPLDMPFLPLDKVSEAVYAAIPKKLGDREYWSEWAKDIGLVAERLIARINKLIEADQALKAEFAVFVKGLQDTLNPAVSKTEAVEMLAQHTLTLPVFQALFAGSDFPENNVVAKALQKVVDRLDAAAVASETEELEKFYDNVRERVHLAKSDKSKQDIVRNLYDTFFHYAFPRMAKRLGIVYTPIEIVDFILHSVQACLQKHLDCSLGDRNVHILDPFAGTGTFLVRLIQSGLLSDEDLLRKYRSEMSANEIVLLAYYIATVNIETALQAATGIYQPFGGMVLVDTFQMTEEGDLVDRVVLPENNQRVVEQLSRSIRVVVGNPPYSAQQKSENDDNKKPSYPTLDAQIRATYAARSNAQLLKNLYDSYVRAIRWASNRIQDRGVAAFVTNGSFLDANNMDGLRKCLVEEYSQLYIFNLRGNIRGKAGDEAKQEGGNVFDIMTGVVISVLVKNPSHTGEGSIYYHDIGAMLSKEDKLKQLVDFRSIETMTWRTLSPNTAGDWVNQRDPLFERFTEVFTDADPVDEGIFLYKSLGMSTGRDPWVYNYSASVLSSNVDRFIEFYNQQMERYTEVASKRLGGQLRPQTVVDMDSTKISWSSKLFLSATRGVVANAGDGKFIHASYRPFCKQHMYVSNFLVERPSRLREIFPDTNHGNVVIYCTGLGASKGFSALASDATPNLHYLDSGRCFPLY